MSIPVNLNPLFAFFKQLGIHQKTRLKKRSDLVKEMKNSLDCAFVLYVLTSGVIDDIDEVIKTVQQPEWDSLPLQIQVISLAPSIDSQESHQL